MLRWLVWLLAPDLWLSQLSPQWWHAHEMVFGFALPVVAGFLLTAVATWTGLPGSKGGRLQLLFGTWLLARLILWLWPEFAGLAWALEMLFILVLIWELGSRVWAQRQWRNMIFLPVLIILAVLCSGSYLSLADPVSHTRWHYGAIWFVSLLVVVVGGRVIPLFTSNKLGIHISAHPQWLDQVCIGLIVLIALLPLFPLPAATNHWLATLYFTGGALHLYRVLHWQGHKTLAVPLLWSMHLSYLCIPLALLGLGLSSGNIVAQKHIMHLLAVGTISGMILTMMSRVSLGHTGRPLRVPAHVSLSFVLVFSATLVRVGIPILEPKLTLLAWKASALMWVLAFAIFLYHYVPILLRPRIDGKPG